MILELAFCLAQTGSTKADLPYVEKGTEEQKLDLYLPAKRPFKTILFAYGGGWHSGSRKNMAVLGKRFQDLGYACAMIGYRLMPPHQWPAQIDDAADASAWVEKHIGEYGGDPKQVWLAGHSSGAQLVLLLVTDSSWLAKRGIKPTDFRGVIGLSTPLDLEPQGKGVFADGLMAGQGAAVFGRHVATMKQASPIDHIPGITAPPVLLLAGDGDMPGFADDEKRFADLANKAGAKVTYAVVAGKDHMGVVRGLMDDDDAVFKKVKAFVGAP